MIILPSLFLILAIFSTITKQQQPTHSFAESQLDWSTCGKQTRCYCADEQTGQTMLEKTTGIPRAEPDTPKNDIGMCNIGVQNRYFSEEKAVFQFQVIGKTEALGDNPQLTLSRHKLKIGCKKDNTGKMTLVTTDENTRKKYRISLFEDRSRLDQGFFLCAIKIDSIYELDSLKDDPESSTYNNAYTKMEFTISSTIQSEYQTSEAGARPWSANNIACDAYSFRDLSSSPKYHVLPLVNRDNQILNCKNYGPTYTMRYDKKQTAPLDDISQSLVNQLNCIENTQKPGSFYFELDEGTVDAQNLPIPPARLETPGDYTFYCAAEFNEVCEDPKIDCKKEPCPVYHAGKQGQPAEITCVDKKWKLEGEYHELEKNAACERDLLKGQNDVAFFVKLPSGTMKKVEKSMKIECFTNYDCQKKTELSFLSESILYDPAEGIAKCNDSTIDLSIYSFSSNATQTAKQITCEPAEGKWKNSTGNYIEAGSQIRCPVKESAPDSSESEAQFSDAQIYGGIVVVSIVFLVLSVLAILGVMRCHRHFKRALPADKQWRKQSKFEKLEECKRVFGSVLKTTPTTAHDIRQGLAFLELLLDTETDDPRIWDVVYPFLMRCHGAIVKIDHQIWHMFSRFCYLRARRIIDKHGWLTPTIIRNNNQKGVIRTVAIRLLSFGIGDMAIEEAELMIEEGFRALCCEGLEQYPHCGVLWSVILHARPDCRRHVESAITRIANSRMFLDHLKAIALLEKGVEAEWKMPRDEVIPEFGSVAEQAAFAIGGSNSITYHQINARYLLPAKFEGEAISREYVKGMCNSICRNPWPFLDEAYISASFIDNLLQKMREEITETALNNIMENSFGLMTYYGRRQDAVHMQAAFMTGAPERINKLISDLATEQLDFEKAMTEQLEQIREWHAANTDKAELKTKPVYADGGGKIKLDTRMEEQMSDAKALAAAAAGDDCSAKYRSSADKPQSSGGGAGTGSTSSNDATPATPVEPASAPDGAAAATPPPPPAAAPVSQPEPTP